MCHRTYHYQIKKLIRLSWHLLATPFAITILTIAWKVSKYGVFSGPYFPVLRLNMDVYSVNLRIQTKYRKIRTRKKSVFGHFSRSEPSPAGNYIFEVNIRNTRARFFHSFLFDVFLKWKLFLVDCVNKYPYSIFLYILLDGKCSSQFTAFIFIFSQYFFYRFYSVGKAFLNWLHQYLSFLSIFFNRSCPVEMGTFGFRAQVAIHQATRP